MQHATCSAPQRDAAVPRSSVPQAQAAKLPQSTLTDHHRSEIRDCIATTTASFLYLYLYLYKSRVLRYVYNIQCALSTQYSVPMLRVIIRSLSWVAEGHFSSSLNSLRAMCPFSPLLLRLQPSSSTPAPVAPAFSSPRKDGWVGCSRDVGRGKWTRRCRAGALTLIRPSPSAQTLGSSDIRRVQENPVLRLAGETCISAVHCAKSGEAHAVQTLHPSDACAAPPSALS